MPRTRVSTTALGMPSALEQILVTTPGISPAAGQPIDLSGEIDVSPGTSTTGVTVNIRRGPATTGPIVATVGPVPPAAAARGVIPIHGTDTQGVDVANQVYILTATQNGASVAGTCNYAYLRADWG